MERAKKDAGISPAGKLHIIYVSVIMLLSLSFAITFITMKNQIDELKKNSSVSQLPQGHPQVDPAAPASAPEAAMPQGNSMPGASGGEPPFVKKMIEEYRTALSKDPNDTKALTGLGNLYFDSGQYAKAIEYYEKSQAIDTKNSGLTSDLATCYFYTNNNDKAIKGFKLAIELDPQNLNARYNLGLVYKTVGKIPDARKEWEEMKKYLSTDDEKKKLQSVLDSLGKS